MNLSLIEKLKTGKYELRYDNGNLEQLREVLKAIGCEDYDETTGELRYYWEDSSVYMGSNIGSMRTTIKLSEIYGEEKKDVWKPLKDEEANENAADQIYAIYDKMEHCPLKTFLSQWFGKYDPNYKTEWQPKNGEMVEVSDSAHFNCSEERKFFTMDGSLFVCHDNDNDYGYTAFHYCRPACVTLTVQEAEDKLAEFGVNVKIK